MEHSLNAVFLDFETLGPAVNPEPLERLAAVEYFQSTETQQLDERLENADIVLANKVPLDEATLRAAPRLKLVVLAATGTDQVSLDTARELGIAVYNIRDYCTASVAQHVFALVLTLTHRPTDYHRRVVEGAWQAGTSFCLFDYPIRELRGLRLGLVGFGALARGVKGIAEAFGLEVLIAARPGTPAAEVPQGRVILDELLPAVDILSLHCPLTAATHRLIGAPQLARMKPDALLINTARGALIDPEALIEALRAGAIGGAGIDVLEQEPPPAGHPLLANDIPNLIVTPHIAWAAREARQRAVQQMAENIEDFLAGRSTRRVV